MLIKNLTIWGLAREYAGIERKCMSMETGLSYGNIAFWETGRTTPRKASALIMYNYLLPKLEVYKEVKIKKLIKKMQEYIETAREQERGGDHRSIRFRGKLI